MLWAFIGQIMLIGLLLAFVDHFPSWLLKIMVVTAGSLPIAVYLSIIRQPLVYHAWQAALWDLFHGGVSCLAALWGCLRVRTIFRVYHHVASLKVFPDAPDAWAALALFPFKVYVLMAMPFLWLSYSLVGWLDPRVAYTFVPEAAIAVSGSYVLCLIILLFGALAQALCGHRDRPTRTLVVVIVGFVLLRTLSSWGTVR